MVLPAWLVRAWRAIERFAESGWGAPSLFAAALVVYALVSLALPLSGGRDLARYLLYYAQLFDDDVVYPNLLVTRTPGTPLVTGVLLEGGPVVSEVASALLYALSVLAWCSVARRLGPSAAIATAAALLLYPGYIFLFHQLSSDALFAAGFALVAVLVARAAERPNARRAAMLGLGIAALVLIRPVGQVLLLLVFVPLVSAKSWRGRAQGVAALVVAAALPLLAWAGHNAVRGDDLTVVRGGSASMLFRTFVADRIVEPENGPASEALARAVARDLLPHEPYRAYGIDSERFFSSGSARIHDDLYGLADRTWGWDDDYEHLAQVGREAVRSHPGPFVRGVASDFRDLLVWPLYAVVAEEASGATQFMSPDVVSSGELPVPSEGEPIPSSRLAPYLSTPDGRIDEVWTSPTEHSIVFRDRSDQIRGAELDRRVDELLAAFPDRDQRPALIRWLNEASRWYPRPIMWLLLGLGGVLIRRPRGMAVPLALSGVALLLVLATSLAVYAVAEYSVPVAPAFVVLATTGLCGRRST